MKNRIEQQKQQPRVLTEQEKLELKINQEISDLIDLIDS